MLVAHVVGASPFGGVIPYIDSLINGVSTEGLKSCVVCNNHRVVKHFEDRSIEVIDIPHFRREIDPIADLMSLSKLSAAFRKLKPTIVHTHTSKGGFIGRLAARSADVPVIVHTVHGFAFHDFSPAFSTWAYSRLEKIAGRCCDAMISVNSKDRDRAIKLGIMPADHIHVVYNGIDLSRFPPRKPDPTLRQELGLPESTPLLAFVGRLAPQKSPNTLIRGMATLVAQGSNAHLLVVGDGPMRKELEDQVHSMGISSAISFLGFRSDIARILNTSDVFLLPSLWEGLPISLLEAMACSLPSVVSDIKGNNEVVEHNVNGMVFRPNDYQQMALYAQYLLDNPEAARLMGRRARETVEARFTETRMVTETMKVYRSLLQTKLGVA